MTEDVACMDRWGVRVVLMLRSRRAYLLYGRDARPRAEELERAYAGRGYAVELVEARSEEAERIWREYCP